MAVAGQSVAAVMASVRINVFISSVVFLSCDFWGLSELDGCVSVI